MGLSERKAALISLLRDDNDDVKKSAAKALERMEAGPKIAVLIKAASSTEKAARVRAVQALAETDADDVLQPLLVALNDPEPGVRAAAIKGLGRRADPRSFAALLQRLNEPTAAIRVMAVEALSNFKNTNVRDILISLLKAEKSLEVVLAALDALGRLGDSKAEEPLLRFLSYPDPRVKIRAALALGNLKD